MQGLATHQKTSISLPASGITVITGPNGAGKSTVMEAVAAGLWGRSLRGSVAWQGKESSVTVTTPDVTVTRTRKGSRSTLKYRLHVASLEADAMHAHSSPEHDTATAAQEALQPLIGSFDAWRKAHVFSSADVASFAASGDAERKRHLEALLGLDLLERCWKLAGIKQKEITQELRAAEQWLVGCESGLAEAKRAAGDKPVSADFETDIASAKDAHAVAQQELTRLVHAATAAEMALVKASQIEAAAVSLYTKAVCPTCKRALTTDDAESCTQALASIDDAEAARRLAEKEVKYARHHRQLADTFCNEAYRTYINLKAQRDMHANALARWETAKLRVTELAVKADAARKKHDELLNSCNAAAAVVALYGSRGLPAHLLDKVLADISQRATVWLAKIGSSMQVTLSSTSERADGKTAQVLCIAVSGVGATEYREMSGGERRRLDVALLLAIADVAGGKGTLWFDEVFDSLDSAGRQGVAEALRDASQHRPIVVITHADELARALRPQQWIHVNNGQVTQERL